MIAWISSYKIVVKYYDYLEIHNKPQYVYNVDETGLSGSQGCTIILCKKGTNILILIALKLKFNERLNRDEKSD
jgi:hypothetical protein